MLRRCLVLSLCLALLPWLTIPQRASADHLDPKELGSSIRRTWSRTDYAVQLHEAARTWMWGPPEAMIIEEEPYAEAPGGSRFVFYFEKSRMEVTCPVALCPGADPTATWYVTNGLLALEMIGGLVQVGDANFQSRGSADINVAGDSDDPTGPTYATFLNLLDSPPATSGSLITQRVDRAGNVINDPNLAGRNVTAAQFVPETNHQVAAPFWTFMNSSGLTWDFDSRAFVNAPLFENPYYATGFPVTEPYWANVKVGGTYRDVLMQCFERRCLTYSPDNPEGWKVEMGNIGLHYHEWRYGVQQRPTPDVPVPAEGDVTFAPDMSTQPSFGTDDGTVKGYYDAATSSYVIENALPADEFSYPGFLWWGPDASSSDYSVTADIVTLSGETTFDFEAGLFYRLESDGQSATAFGYTGMDTTGLVSSWYLGATSSLLTDFDPAPTFNLGNGAVNTMKIIVKGHHAWVFLNGQFVQDFDLPAEADIAANGFALAVYKNDADPTRVAKFGFRNVAIRDVH